jgi:Tol biopolymer transport system component
VPRFSPDGQSIAYRIVNSLACKIYVVAASGGEPRQLDPGFADAHGPIWSPDGKSLLVLGRVKPEMPDNYWYVLPADGSPAIRIPVRERLNRVGVNVDYYALGAWLHAPGADDVVLFSGKLKDSTNVWQLALDPKTGQPTGEPVRLTLGQNERQPRSAQNDAPGKRVVFVNLQSNEDLYSVALDAARSTNAGEQKRLTDDLATDRNPYLSTDGRVLTFLSGRGGTNDLWKRTFPATGDTPLGYAALKPYEAALSHDGSNIVFSTPERRLLYLGATAGGYPQKICDDCGIPQDFSPDGKLILYVPGSFRSINSLDAATGAKTVLFRHPSWSLFGARFSPDGRWIAFYTVNPTRQVWMARFRPGLETPPSEWVKLTVGEQPDASPVWSPDARLVYYLSDRDGFRCVWGQSVVAETPSGAPFPVCHFHNTRLKPDTSPAVVTGLAVSRDKLVVPLVEQTGNIWMASR